MNNMLRYFLFTFFGLLFSSNLISQDAGATFYTGISAGFTKDSYITQKNELHFGYNLGLDARINSGALYFLISGEYGKLDFRGVQENSLFSGDKVNLFKGRAGLGFKVLRITERIYFASRLQGAFNIVTDYNSDNQWLKDNKINDGFMGVNTGLEFHFYSFWASLEYEKGFMNMYYKRPDSAIDFLAFKVGVKF
jgi:hypothetical protein